MPYQFPPDLAVLVQQQMLQENYETEDALLKVALQALAVQDKELQDVQAAIDEWQAGDEGVPVERAFAELKKSRHIGIFALIVSLYCLYGTLHAAEPPAATKPAAAPQAAAPKTDKAEKDDKAKKREWTALFDGKSLTNWTAPNFGTQGEVEVKDGQLILNFGDGCTGVTWTKDFPKSGYEIEVEAMRVDGRDFFCGLTFPVGEDPLTLIIGGWGGSVVGISSLDGFSAVENDTASQQEFKNKQWYKIRLRVIPERITAWIDDKEVVDRDIRGAKLSIRNEVALSKPLGLTSWKTTAAYKTIQYRLLSDKEKAEAKPKEVK